MENLKLAPKIYMSTLLLLKISASSFPPKMLATSCATRQHTISELIILKIWIRHPKFTCILFDY